jgi:hypothetical protein
VQKYRLPSATIGVALNDVRVVPSPPVETSPWW